ncbi:MAG: hypothetical protein QM783_03960 [Phycisphaerales bacterium]
MSGYELTAHKKECPACNRPAAADAVLCTNCGMNFQSGMRTQEAARDPSDAQRRPSRSATPSETKSVHRCKCGYDLTGLGAAPCPECGRTPEARRKGGKLGTREERRQESIRDYWRSTMIALIVGTSLGVIVTFAFGAGVRHLSPLVCVLQLAVCEVCLFVAYFAICLMFWGFEEDIRGLVLRLVGVGSVWSALLMMILSIRSIGLMMMVGVAVMSVCALALPLTLMTGRDYMESTVIGLVAWVMYIGGSAILAALMAG